MNERLSMSKPAIPATATCKNARAVTSSNCNHPSHSTLAQNDDTSTSTTAIVDVVEDDWQLPLDFSLFAQHDRHRVYLSSSSSSTNQNENHQTPPFFELACVESLTPLDMMTLSSGLYDTTGHCAWMGAYLLVACLGNDHDMKEDDDDEDDTNQNDEPATRQREAIKDNTNTDHFHDATSRICPLQAPVLLGQSFLRTLFYHRHIIELGCGTGIGGIAVLISSLLLEKQQQGQPQACHRKSNHNHNDASSHDETWLCFTDADPNALTLCDQNCQLNQLTKRQRTRILSRQRPQQRHQQQLSQETNGQRPDDLPDPAVKQDNDSCSCPATTEDRGGCCSYDIEPLTWTIGRDDNDPPFPPGCQGTFDTVLATDVLYDIGILPALFGTASRCLKQPQPQGGDLSTSSSAQLISHPLYFVLSHVPRACFSTEHPPPPPPVASFGSMPSTDLNGDIVDNDTQSSDSRRHHSHLVEDLILERAQEFGFELYTIIRPSMIRNAVEKHEPENSTSTSLQRRREYPDALNTVSLLEMEQVGAAVLVFRKTKNYYGSVP